VAPSRCYVFSWIHNHLEEYPETSLPKQEVYDEYKSFCDNLNYHPLSAADFGKMMKNVFPNMKARRLGMRGKSKRTYCYSGLRKRPFVQTPSLPSLDLCKTGEGCQVSEAPGQLSNLKEDVRFAACDLVCEWAQKVLKRQFDAVEDLARFLIDSHYISNKSLAALTITASTAADVSAPQSASAFVPAAELHSFQPHVSILAAPSVDAQQLQRKIQRRQQEQKLHSPSPEEGQVQKADDSVPCTSPSAPSPQPTIGIMVAAVPSPIPVQQNSPQLISSAPSGIVDKKMLPVNFQLMTQPVQALKPGPPSAQNLLVGPSAEAAAPDSVRSDPAQPSAAAAITLHSPSAMIIGNSPIKTVMTTCHVSPVSLVKMAPISLALNSSCTTTSLSQSGLLSAPAGISIPAAEEEDAGLTQSMRSSSEVPILAPVAGPGPAAEPHASDVEMEVEAIHKNSQMQTQSRLILAQEATPSRAGVAVQRAASVPIPHTRGFLSPEELSGTNFRERSSSNTDAAESKIGSSENTSTLQSVPSDQNTTAASLPGTALLEEQSRFVSKGFSSTKTLRKRSGVSPDLSLVKRVYMPQQAAGGAAGPGYRVRNAVCGPPKAGAPARPESAPPPREVEMKYISPANVHALCTSSFRAGGFCSVAKTQSSIQRKNTSTVMKTSTSLSHPSIQQQQAHTMANMHAICTNAGPQTHPGDTHALRSKSATENPEAGRHAYPQPSCAAEHFFHQGPPFHQLPPPSDCDYFQFDDDVTQDSIVEELVQMEEQMKLNLQHFGGCAPAGQQPAAQSSKLAAHQNLSAYYQTASRHSNPIQTPTPTPTPTSEMLGGSHGLAGESPCSHMASVTPVDSALGSSRHTPVGTPHSNSSSTVPCSPVECRNPFAFTPINSSVTGLHDGSTVSNSPVKPMQRPTATHPDKTRLEWMNWSLNKSNGGMGIAPSYQGLIGDHFQKPHAFAVPHARHHDTHFGRLTPVSPVQQQAASMAGLNRQEEFAVPAPLDNKASNAPSTTSRCRSVSPAVHQRNLSGNAGSVPYVPRSVLSPFSSPVTPEMLNIFGNGQTGVGVSGLAQRSHSVPLNVMMQTEVAPAAPRQGGVGNEVLLRKLEEEFTDGVQGLGNSHVPSSYTARLNLTQVLESRASLSGENVLRDKRSSLRRSARPCRPPRSAPTGQPLLFSLSSQQHPQLDFSCTMKDLLTDTSIAAGLQQMEEAGLAAVGSDVSCDIRMKSELPSSISDLNAMDTNLLFDPDQQQGQYLNAAADVAGDHLFQHSAGEVAHSAGLDWLESKDHPAVGLMG
uniref:Regulatory factor X7a n=1 Tax=Tetraodon nigroviridis TaxID=99883 RepID=H3CVA5_TETNG